MSNAKLSGAEAKSTSTYTHRERTRKIDQETSNLFSLYGKLKTWQALHHKGIMIKEMKKAKRIKWWIKYLLLSKIVGVVVADRHTHLLTHSNTSTADWPTVSHPCVVIVITVVAIAIAIASPQSESSQSAPEYSNQRTTTTRRFYKFQIVTKS